VGLCLFHRITGLECPGCGMTRAFHAITHGQMLEAIGYNLLSVPLFSAMAIVLLIDLANLFRGIQIKWKVKEKYLVHLEWIGVGLVITYGISRNITSIT